MSFNTSLGSIILFHFGNWTKLLQLKVDIDHKLELMKFDATIGALCVEKYEIRV